MLTADVCIYTNWLLIVLRFSYSKNFSKKISFLQRPNLVRNQLEVCVPPISVPCCKLQNIIIDDNDFFATLVIAYRESFILVEKLRREI
jgi:hypothetical protein